MMHAEQRAELKALAEGRAGGILEDGILSLLADLEEAEASRQHESDCLEAAKSRISELESERDKLVLTVADHVTARCDRQERIADLEAKYAALMEKHNALHMNAHETRKQLIERKKDAERYQWLRNGIDADSARVRVDLITDYCLGSLDRQIDAAMESKGAGHERT